MKTLKKISINPEKVIKNEELVNLRGGYNGGSPCCSCLSSYSPYNFIGGIVGSSQSECDQDCKAVYGSWVKGAWDTAC